MAVGGLCSPRVSYILAELEDVDAVFAPIKTASRVKVNLTLIDIVFKTHSSNELISLIINLLPTFLLY